MPFLSAFHTPDLSIITRGLATNVTVTRSSKSAKSPTQKKKRTQPEKKSLNLPNMDKEQALMSLQQTVKAHHQHGQYHEALKASIELLNETQKHFGKDHPATASAYNNVGLLQKLLGLYKDSKRHFHEALRIYGRVVGKDHASYATALHNLANLHRAQITLDEEMSGLERMQLHEECVSYLEEAYTIYQVELGKQHPHTIACRSHWGSTIASQVLLQQQQLQQQQQQSQTGTLTASKPSKWTRKRWEAAEEHLRAALETATQHPRGKEAEVEVDASSSGNHAPIRTLSAALAAQNLAVFLKTRAAAAEAAKIVVSSESQEEEPKLDPSTFSLQSLEWLDEAQSLYEQSLHVRRKLLQESHPEVVATNFSLAELLSLRGEEDAANALREEIMEAYQVTEVDEPPEASVVEERKKE